MSRSHTAIAALIALTGLFVACAPPATMREDAALREIPCTQARSYPPPLNCDSSGYTTVQHQVCINFKRNGCIDSTTPVTPETVYACPNDNIRWVGTGEYTGTKRFEVYFIPVRTGKGRPEQERGRSSHGPWKVLPGVPRGKDARNVNIEYKYTVRGGRDTCGARVFDPRIKIDPK